MPNLPANEPLLAELRFVDKGNKPQNPIACLPLLRPAKGSLANGSFDTLFRAGIPWGWISEGEAILRETKGLGKDYQRSGNSVAMVIFDNYREYRFADQLRIPVVAAQRRRYKASCWVRLFSEEQAEASVRVSLNLIDPNTPQPHAADGSIVSRDWAVVETEVVTPCDAPTLMIDVQSDRLPASGSHHQWILSIDDVNLTPLPSQTK